MWMDNASAMEWISVPGTKGWITRRELDVVPRRSRLDQWVAGWRGEVRETGRRSRVHVITSQVCAKCGRKVDNGTSITLSNKDTTTSVESCIKTKPGSQALIWSFANPPLERCCFSSITSWPGRVEVTARTNRVSKVRVFQEWLTEANISGIFDRVWERQMG